MGIVCAAVVGQQNNPLFIKTLSPVDDEVKFHYMVHASLDAVEEKVCCHYSSRSLCRQILEMAFEGADLVKTRPPAPLAQLNTRSSSTGGHNTVWQAAYSSLQVAGCSSSSKSTHHLAVKTSKPNCNCL